MFGTAPARQASLAAIKTPVTNAPLLPFAQFRYDLPEELIAQRPAEPRGSSRLLLSRLDGGVSSHVFSEFDALIPSGAHLVFNHSSVVNARLRAQLPNAAGSIVEVMLLAPVTDAGEADPARAFGQPAHGQVWRGMVRHPVSAGGVALRVGDGRLQLEVLKVLGEWDEPGESPGVEAELRLQYAGAEMARSIPMSDLLEQLGEVPIPPYVRGGVADSADATRYQTVFASREAVGSVAAPTAGLHFTPEMLHRLVEKRGATLSHIALHVGAGTFKPVIAEDASAHVMHTERFEASLDALEDIARSAADGRPIIAVGTTTVRVLESLVRLGGEDWQSASTGRAEAAGGVREWQGLGAAGAAPEVGHLGQWEAYGDDGRAHAPSRDESALALRRHVQRARMSGASSVRGSTSLCVAPGFDFALCDGLLTNFHAPDSTLLMITAAAAGGAEQLRESYQYAVRERFRFLSYGDACLFLRV
jgi:S-adenosylmethionine:tRNA ribosyltransferase-isomerase